MAFPRGVKFPRTWTTAERLRGGSDQDPVTGCWVWTRAALPTGYGKVSVDGVLEYAHRASYQTFVGAIPDGMYIDHLCLNKSCVNPAHLEVVPPIENGQRAQRIGHPHFNAPTTCGRGHDWSVHPPNVTRRANGRDKRDCSVCAQIRRSVA